MKKDNSSSHTISRERATETHNERSTKGRVETEKKPERENARNNPPLVRIDP
jgi:hypothetical protein